jgi:DNA-binding response OmpR family regulator
MEGYRFAFTHEAQAIILDQEMPDGNGEYILRRLKESPATEGIPVIVLTGTKDQALARRMYNLGAARFLTKPVDWEDLWAELQPLVQRERELSPHCEAALN